LIRRLFDANLDEMSEAATWLEAADMPPWSTADQAAQDLVEFWRKATDAFLVWERETFIVGEPTPDELSEHKKAHKLILRFTLLVYAQVADPDFPARELLPEVAGRLKQIEDSWELVHNPMTDAEADAILARAFPDAPGTGNAP
jgi:hypothetical protein